MSRQIQKSEVDWPKITSEVTPIPCLGNMEKNRLWERGQSLMFQSSLFRSLCVTWDKSMGLHFLFRRKSYKS